MVLSLRDESMEMDPIIAFWDKFMERFSEPMKKLTDQLAESLKQAWQNSEPKHSQRVLISGYTEDDDCLCEVTDSIRSVYQDESDEDDVDLDFKEEESHQRQLQIRQEDDRVIPEVGDHKDLLAKIEDPNSTVTQVCAESIHDKVISVSQSDFSSPSLIVNTALGMFSTNENKFLITVNVFDENPKRNGYTVALNPEPPDEYGLLIHGGTLTKLKLDPRTVKPIDIVENYEGRSVAMDVHKVFDKGPEREMGNNKQATSDGIQETQVILKFNKYFVEGNPSKKMVQVSPGTSNTSQENWLVNSFKNTYVECLVDQKFDMLQYGCSTKGKCDKIIIIAPVKQKKEQVFELIQRAKCESIETFHKFSQQGNKGVTYAKYSEAAAHRSLEKFLLHFPGGQPNIGQGNWTNVSTTMYPRRGVKPMSGDPPLQLGPNTEDVEKPINPLVFLLRLILGKMAGVYYVLVTSATLVPFIAPQPYLMLLSMLNEFHNLELCYVARVKMKYIIFLNVELELSKHSTNWGKQSWLILQSDRLQSSETDNCFIMQTFINGELAETMKLLLADGMHEALKIVGTMLKESPFDFSINMHGYVKEELINFMEDIIRVQAMRQFGRPKLYQKLRQVLFLQLFIL